MIGAFGCLRAVHADNSNATAISNLHEPLNRHVHNNPSNRRRAASLWRRTKEAGSMHPYVRPFTVRERSYNTQMPAVPTNPISARVCQIREPYSRNVEADRKDSLS